MEKKKYLTVAPSQLDKRAVNISITTEGYQAFRVCSERTDEFLADIFREFTTEELETFCTLLRKLYRFDGQEQEDFEENMDFHTSDTERVLQHHQKYLKRRTDNHK
ncbi:hypothetical protein N752_11895 [Desulforamulus aquiferis]|nr:hypothetical protein [Desulforamulus aquiferis]RYD04881.1 hypothetical protein N752_11895 [Desulforamulus aquiferis]